MNARTKNRKGFTILELSVVMMILTIMTVGIIKATSSSKENLRQQKELHFASTFERAINLSAEAVIDTYTPACSQIATTATTTWGWQSANCTNTSPFPAHDDADAVMTSKIVYNLGSPAAIDAASRTNLINTITEAYSPYCRQDSLTATALTLNCPGLVDLSYSVGGPALSTVHGTVGANGILTAQGNIDPQIPPTYSMTYRRVRENGMVTEMITHTGSFAQLWQKRQNISMEQQRAISTAIKGFHNTRLALEVNNAAPTGLNSVDDEFTPWFWRVFGDNAAQVTSTAAADLCNVVGGTCTNLNTANIWQTAALSQQVLWINMIQNILPANRTVTVDGFGNAMRIVPVMSVCTNTNLNLCNAPVANTAPVPADNYFSLATAPKPPFVTAIYSISCNDTTVTAPQYCRNLISY